MSRYFSEESQKKIADAVKWVQQNSVDETAGADGAINPGRPPRFYKTQEIAPEQIPTDQEFFGLECVLYNVKASDNGIGGLIGEETNVIETVYFNYVPNSNEVFQAAQFMGKPFAIKQAKNLQPVSLIKSSGEAGDLTTKCSFKYDIYSLDGDEKLASDVDPARPFGLFERTDFGAYKEATAGLAWNLTPTEFEIAWCNEVPEVAECTSSDDIGLMWAGVYDESKTYPANNAVTDGPYMMVSNKTTDTKPAPQPLSEPEFKIGTVPTWAQVSGAGFETITGQRYTWSRGGQLLKVRVYIPAPSGGGGGGGGGGVGP